MVLVGLGQQHFLEEFLVYLGCDRRYHHRHSRKLKLFSELGFLYIALNLGNGLGRLVAVF
jgi:hypothetical protein